MLAAAERGCLVVGDITGCSDHLRDAELEHAQDVLAGLLETVVRHLTATLRFSKLKADAAPPRAPRTVRPAATSPHWGSTRPPSWCTSTAKSTKAWEPWPGT